MITYTLKIVDIYSESPDSVTIAFKQPALKKVRFKPGQYLTVAVTVNNRKYKRAYSFSSAPNESTLNITVKRVAHGIVSNHLIDVVKIGDMLEVMEPMGDFIYDDSVHNQSEVFLWGAGSGITPLMSILKTALLSGHQKVKLFYVNKNLQQTIFYKQLIELQSYYPEYFSIDFFFTSEQSGYGKFGRITENDIHTGLHKSADINKTVHYICGPAALKETVKQCLLKAGANKEQIFSEDFENIVNEIDLKDIHTQFIEVNDKGKKSIVEVIRGKSILEACLDNQLDLPYSCQTGTCTLCKAILIAGEVKKIGEEKMDHEIAENERLLCCSYPLNSDVVFEIN